MKFEWETAVFVRQYDRMASVWWRKGIIRESKVASNLARSLIFFSDLDCSLTLIGLEAGPPIPTTACRSQGVLAKASCESGQ